MINSLWGKIRRASKKPPKYIVFRLWHEIKSEIEQYAAPFRPRLITKNKLCREFNCRTFDDLWQQLYEANFPYWTTNIAADDYDYYCPGDSKIIFEFTEKALAHKVDLMGSGEVYLGQDIRWNEDYKTGQKWHNRYFRRINYNNPELPSDVKFTWELSRIQWLIPVVQAYLLTGDEKYAAFVRKILEQWIIHNSYAHSINWACTMEVAIRLFNWIWIFKCLGNSEAWNDEKFKFDFLKTLYLHGEFTERHIEKSDINGNHYTADAAAMVFAGLFFKGSKHAARWSSKGWAILVNEILVQVFKDGVDYEASVPYHRLVQELFLYSAQYRLFMGHDVPGIYRSQLKKMALFTRAYSQPDGLVPLWGDADDARILPFGNQDMNDHRYLLPIAGNILDIAELSQGYSGCYSEIFWILGPEKLAKIKAEKNNKILVRSTMFNQGGFYIMRNHQDHVFIDCGPVGLAGRGGHGHNDNLSFELMLSGQKIVSDCGAYIYTGSYKERNNFRSTAYHNTPQIDNQEINRFISDDYIWLLHDDARPDVRKWETSEELDIFIGSHSGYLRLREPVAPIRTIKLYHKRHKLEITDKFEGEGPHKISVPLHLAPGVKVACLSDNTLKLIAGDKEYYLTWFSEGEWKFSQQAARISRSYGILEDSIRLVWERNGSLEVSLKIEIGMGNE